MANETIVAAFDTPAHAEAAVRALRAGGFANSDISMIDGKALAGSKTVGAPETKAAGVWNRLFGRDVHQHEAAIYNQTIQRGGAVVAARVVNSEVAHALAILNLHYPIDVHDRAVTAGISSAAHVEAVEKKIEAAPLVTPQQVAVPTKLAEAHDEILRLAEEQLEVGKRMVESGRTRVRRFVTERPVSANVTLREEHAEVLRRAITDPKFIDTVDWADRQVEVIETAEHALVNKTARIVEEVSLRKVATEHVETVSDKIRRQQVEIEHLGPDGRVIPVQQKPGQNQGARP